jgi:F-type H+-transporting ATPase subunit delta
MQNPRLASRYAKSLIDLAIEKGLLEAIYKDVLYLNDLIKLNKDLNTMLRSPVIPADKKNKVIAMITDGKINAFTSIFLKLMVTKSREFFLQEVLQSFIQQYKQKKNIHTVKLTTATNLSNEMKTKIVNQVKKTGTDMQNVEVETIVNPDIIGGFILQTGDQLVDASVSYELSQIARQFENNDFIYKVR